eukprot:2415472-Prymnesium_polylepis.2
MEGQKGEGGERKGDRLRGVESYKGGGGEERKGDRLRGVELRARLRAFERRGVHAALIWHTTP